MDTSRRRSWRLAALLLLIGGRIAEAAVSGDPTAEGCDCEVQKRAMADLGEEVVGLETTVREMEDLLQMPYRIADRYESLGVRVEEGECGTGEGQVGPVGQSPRLRFCFPLSASQRCTEAITEALRGADYDPHAYRAAQEGLAPTLAALARSRERLAVLETKVTQCGC